MEPVIAKARATFARLAGGYQAHPVLFVFRAVVLAGIGWIFITRRIFWTPDTLFLILLGLFLVFGQARAFVKRFAPFVFWLLVYESFRSIANDLNAHVHYQAMINADRFAFAGFLPTDVLQHYWWHGTVQWYDFYFYFLYTMHFLAPVLMAVVIWKVRDTLYWPYVTAYIVLSFAASLTYVLFPAAPPWMAADNGYIAHIHRISSDIWQVMGVHNFSEFYSSLTPNQVAAVPSLHSAYPLLIVLFAARLFSWRRTWWLLAYPVSVWVGVVYLGEHYVFDVVFGIFYALAAYKATMQFFAWKAQREFSIRKWAWLTTLRLVNYTRPTVDE